MAEAADPLHLADRAGNPEPGLASQHYEAATDEAALVRRAQNGDHAAFATLLQRHGPRLYHLLLRLAGQAAVAEELFQEVVVHAWQRLDRFHGDSALSTWLWSLARNKAIDVLRRKHPIPRDPELLLGVAEAPRHDPLEREDRHRLLHQALQQLSPEAREIIILRDFQDHDYRSIAAMLDCAEGTVKSRLARARAHLRELLSPHLNSGDLP